MSVEKYISLSEIAYKSGNIKQSIRHAKRGLMESDISNEQSVAFRIFIARAYSKLGEYDKSNTIYRNLLRQDIYIPPVIMGLVYNNFSNTSKVKNGLRIFKLWSN